MKKYFKIIYMVVIVAAVFLPAVNVSAGCFMREDMQMDYVVVPEIDCVKINLDIQCPNDVVVALTNNCNKILVYKSNKLEQIVIGYSKKYYDRDVPQDYAKWDESFYFEDMPENVYTVKFETKWKFHINDNVELLFFVGLPFFVIVGGLVFLIKIIFFSKKK